MLCSTLNSDNSNGVNSTEIYRHRRSDDSFNISTDDAPIPSKKIKIAVKKRETKRKLRPEDQRALQILSEKFRNEENGVKCLVEKCNSDTLKCGKPSNLKRHLSQRHPKLYENLFPQENNSKKRAEIDAFEANQDAIEMVTVNGYPFSILNSSGMKGFIKSRVQAIPPEGRGLPINRRDIVEQVAHEAKLVKNYIAKQLSGRIVSLMFDVCTITTLSMLGINVPFMIDGKTVCWSLGTIRLNERHTAVNLADVIFDILAEYGISLKNVLTMTTDTASNAKATTDVLNLIASMNKNDGDENVTDDSIFDIDSEDGLEFGMDVENEAELQKVMENVEAHTRLVKEMSEIVKAKDNSIRIINQINCSAHVTQLCIKDAFVESDSNCVIDRVHEMCVLMRTQVIMIALRKMDCQIIQPPLDNTTRWNSKFMMVSIHKK